MDIINDITISEFAPVLIPTLCRDKHLINLLESLSKCRYADQTEVYIALDFPAKDGHWPGYKKICDYLDIVGNMSFKQIHVIKRTVNLGIGTNGNHIQLVKEILKRYDRFIMTEDDNVFAEGFLEFMNYNLEKYKDDDHIFGVCGYMYPVYEDNHEMKILQLEHFSAWGFGSWKDKYDNYLKLREDRLEIEQMVNDKSFRRECLIRKPSRYSYLLNLLHGGPVYGDSLISALQLYRDKRSIFPSKSLVRNCGWDGSGSHGGKVEFYLTQSINQVYGIEHYRDATDIENLAVDRSIYEFEKKNTPLIQKILTKTSLRLYRLTGEYYNFSKLRNLYKKLFR